MMEYREHGWEKEGRALERRGFRVLGLLGQGAFSRVYRVEKKEIYACKVSENAGLLEREAFVMSRLQHALFPAYSSLWQEEGCGFLLMEYVPGISMEEMVRRRGGFCARQVALAGAELAAGLCYLHERQEGWLFRDVKPANIVVRQNGRLSLLDFGCVCSSKESLLSQAGSPGFAAPEQLKGEDLLTKACDVYGLGRTLKAVLREEKTIQARGCKRGRSVPDKFTRALNRLLDSCAEEDVSRRLPDMGSVLEMLLPLCKDIIKSSDLNISSDFKYFSEILRASEVRCFRRRGEVLRQEVICRKDICL